MTNRRTWYLAPAIAGALALAQGCVGNIGGAPDADPPGVGPLTCGGEATPVESVPLRRLNATQYRNTLRDLLGDPGLEFALDDGEGPITEQAVRQIRDAGEIAVERRDAWAVDVFPCDVTGEADGACVDTFIDRFGSRAFRRPVTDDERAWLRGVYDEVSLDATFEESMETVLQVILAAPATVYMYEAGTGDEVAGGMRALTAYEVASRLSYFLWNTMPDDALLGAAADGSLDTTDGLAAAAERLLADPRSEQQVVKFFSHWLELDGGRLHHALEDAEKDDTLFPEYDAALQDAMRTESEAFIRRVFYEEGGSFEALFNATYAYVNGPLAQLYGVDGVTGDEFEWVDLDPSERAGLFTRAAFLTVYSTSNVTAPIRRGTWVLKEALCVELGEPPANVDDTPIEGGDKGGEILTVREEVEARTEGNECQSCHQIINPLGFTFEHYDAIGRFQVDEVTSGEPVDATGAIIGSDVDGPVADAVELSTKLSQSAKVRSCFAQKWTDSAFGGEHVELDGCSKERIEERFTETGDMKELLIGIIQSNAFRFINPSEDSQ